MNEEAYVARRQQAWVRLRTLCDMADTTPRSLSAAEMREFLTLYREASADLAAVRTRSANEGLVAFLNDLCARGYAILYRAPRRPIGRAIVEGLQETARVGRRLSVFALLSGLLLFGSAFFVAGLLSADLVGQDAFVPPEARANFDSWVSGQHEARTADQSQLASGFYASNNARVALFTAGVSAGTMGLFSIYLLYMTGAQLGSLAHATAGNNKLDFLLSSIFPHGVPELSGIVLAGAVALRLGWAILSPGVFSRGESLRRAGKDAGVGLLASVILMFIAAPIEGYFSFSPAVPGWIKTTVGCFELVFAILFWVFVGREASAPEKTARA